MREVDLVKLKAAIESRARAAGCLDELLATPDISIRDGKLIIDERAYEAWRLKHALPKPLRGLGDVVAVIAQPIARVIDAAAHTNLQECGGCEKRKDKLNQAFPFAGEA